MTNPSTRAFPLYTAAFALLSGMAQADILYIDDVIVDASLCVGTACVNGESFGADTVRLKEVNTRLHFDDTSIAGGFPNNDWRLIANDNTTGGLSYFAIEDATAGRQTFTIRAGAPASALYVDQQGEVGFGTNNPAKQLHAVKGDTPTLRLEQDGSASFTPYVWDVGGNEAGFFVRNVTTSNQFPFRIRPGADSFALVVDDDNDVGVGAGINPAAPLHVRRATGAATDLLRLENNEGVVLRLVDTASNGQEWTFQSNDGVFRVASPAVPGPELTLTDSGDLTISGEITTSGSCSSGCDRVFDPDYDLKPLAQHNAMMWEQGYLPNVGPTLEDAPMNLSHKVGGILNELEHAHIYIGQLHTQLAQQNALIKAQEERFQSRNIAYQQQIEQLTSRLDALERK